MTNQVRIETDQEIDGRWIAAVPELPVTMVYGESRGEAIARVEALVLRIWADRIENGEPASLVSRLFTNS